MAISIQVNSKRVVCIHEGTIGNGAVLYWMSRDQRAEHNWALLEAARLALSLQRNLVVLFTLDVNYPNATYCHFSFMLKGLKEVQHVLNQHNIPFVLLQGDPVRSVVDFVEKQNVAALFCDFDPLKIKRQWRSAVTSFVSIPVYMVDAHNVVPCWYASVKQEYGAYTFRPKILKLLPEFLDRFPEMPVFEHQNTDFQLVDLDLLLNNLKVEGSAGEVELFKSGSQYAIEYFNSFIHNKLQFYDKERNDPTKDVLSNLSPYLHFGQISAQYIVLQTIANVEESVNRDAFLEQLIVRRELSDNYCWYNSKYDEYAGFPDWAKRTLEKHKKDEREYLYSRQQLELAETHDALWNAAQFELMTKGKMHGYMRMYWAKKILEWTAEPKEAFEIAVYLNDKYSLDGRDPNGYVGCAWAIGGVHDRAWFERPVFGQIRYMNYNGCKSKFAVNQYISRNTKGLLF
jgi:deoxyribodipyrimidine photo-lyase